jgi:cell fate (sporulation/competence/biofilm development) regulator YmcA (YheA/YmcA/DUF963 family)
MKDSVYQETEISSESVVRQAARDFAAALSETPQFKAFEQADLAFRQNQAAQQALLALQEKQQSLRPMMLLNALTTDQRIELQSLQTAFTSQPVVQEYFSTQADLAALCQLIGDQLSQAIGLNYASICASSSCCG